VDRHLEGPVWELVELREDDDAQDVRALGHLLRFDGAGRVDGKGCNRFGSEAVVTADQLWADGFSSTLIGCGGEQQRMDGLTQTTLEAGARWRIDRGVLSIARGRVVLVYEERRSPFLGPDVTPLVEDVQGPQVHRLGWRTEDDGVAVLWEAQDEPGLHSDVVGFRLPPAHEVTGLVPHTGHAAGRGFVFVAARPEHGRLVFVPRDGGPAVSLRRHAVPGATTWHLLAGFVGSPGETGWIAAYDDAGEQVMRSYEIRL